MKLALPSKMSNDEHDCFVLFWPKKIIDVDSAQRATCITSKTVAKLKLVSFKRYNNSSEIAFDSRYGFVDFQIRSTDVKRTHRRGKNEYRVTAYLSEAITFNT